MIAKMWSTFLQWQWTSDITDHAVHEIEPVIIITVRCSLYVEYGIFTENIVLILKKKITDFCCNNSYIFAALIKCVILQVAYGSRVLGMWAVWKAADAYI